MADVQNRHDGDAAWFTNPNSSLDSGSRFRGIRLDASGCDDLGNECNIGPDSARWEVGCQDAGHLAAGDPKVGDARQTLFGAWEGNYIVYNDGHDVALPGSTGPDIGFLMYPQAEVRMERRDSLSPDGFVYAIESEEVAS